MSLINQMLRDLEFRKARQAVTIPRNIDNFDVNVVGEYPHRYSKKKEIYFYILCIVVLCLVGALLFMQYKKTVSQSQLIATTDSSDVYGIDRLSPTIKADSNSTNKIQLGNAISDEPLIAKSSQKVSIIKEQSNLQQLVITSAQDHTKIGLHLSRYTPYKLDYTENAKQISLLLKNTTTANKLTKDMIFWPIESISYENINSDLLVTFSIGEDLIVNASYAKSKLNPLLILDLAKEEPLASDETVADTSQLPLPPITDYKAGANELITGVNGHEELSVKETNDRIYADLYQDALQLVKRGQSAEAIDHLRQIINKKPDYIEARANLAALLISAGDLDDAFRVLSVGLKLAPNSDKLAMLQAKVLLANNNVDYAIRLLEKMAPDVKANPDYYALIAALYQRSNKDKSAINYYEKILSNNPQNSLWWMGLAISNEKIGHNNAALSAYLKANEIGKLDLRLNNYIKSRIAKLTDKKNG